MALECKECLDLKCGEQQEGGPERAALKLDGARSEACQRVGRRTDMWPGAGAGQLEREGALEAS